LLYARFFSLLNGGKSLFCTFVIASLDQAMFKITPAFLHYKNKDNNRVLKILGKIFAERQKISRIRTKHEYRPVKEIQTD